MLCIYRPTMIENLTVFNVCTLFAVMASSAAETNPEQARKLGLVSLEFSIAGIVVTLIIALIVIAVVANQRHSHDERFCSSGLGCVFWDN